MNDRNADSTHAGAGRTAALWRRITAVLASVRLALALLVIILACCIAGVTVVRGAQAGALIFSTLWFNGLLVLLVVNTAFCFFSRIWGRRVTIISFGMILFHLSFVAMFAGIIFNSLFFFRGLIRITEGETLPIGDIRSYDQADWGRFFDLAKFRGEITLVKMHGNYRIGDENKRAAYEIEVGEQPNKQRDIIYITKKLVHDGVQYFNDREGYSLLITYHDRAGRELYGAHIPLQSLKQKNNAFLYTTGTRDGPGSFPYPQEPFAPLFALQASYIPTKLTERDGDAVLRIWPYRGEPPGPDERPIKDERVQIGEKLWVRDHALSVAEVRYWVMMSVRYEPGKPIVLTSFWVALSGIIITFFGRMKKGRNDRTAAGRIAPGG